MPRYKGEKKRASGLFSDGNGNLLFVPTRTMLRIREAATPPAVCGRANISKNQWYSWCDEFGMDHWLLRFLYRLSDAPDGTTPVTIRGQRDLKRPAQDAEFFLTPEMVAFRKQTTPKAIAAAAHRTESSMDHARRKWATLDWFSGWLVNFQNQPENVRVATEREIDKCYAAWNSERRLAELRISWLTYQNWFDDFPQDAVIAWLLWLYGGVVPNGWFVFPDEAIRLRARLSSAKIAEAADIGDMTLTRWRGDRLKWQAVCDAVDHNRHRAQASAPRKSAAWNELYAEARYPSSQDRHNAGLMRKTMLRYADFARIGKARETCSLSQSRWNRWRNEARTAGGVELAERFVQHVLSGEPGQYGVVAPGLFVPVDTMRRFQTTSQDSWHREKIINVANAIPAGCFRAWMIDWTVPRKLRQVYESIIRAATEPAEPDGPVTGHRFRWNGELFDGLNPLEWRLIKTLWESESHAVPFQELAEPVWEDAAILINQNRFGGARKRANRFFKDRGIPIVIEGPAHTAILHVESGNGKF